MAKSETTAFVGSEVTKPATFPPVVSGKIIEYFDITTHTDGTALVRSTGHSSHALTDGDCRYIEYIEQAFYSAKEDPSADTFVTITKGGTSGGADVENGGNAKDGCLMLVGH